MPSHSPPSPQADGTAFSLTALGAFMLITFGLAWGILGLYILAPTPMNALFGELTGEHPLFYLAVYAPAIAAVLLVVGKTGVTGLRRYLSRLLQWRCSPWWYLFLLAGIPLIFIGGAALMGRSVDDWLSVPAGRSLLLLLLLTLLKGPVEELGWRGFALPLLQRRFAPFMAGLILGIIWALWHLPAFLLSGTPQGAWDFTPFFAGAVAVSLIVTALFNASRGSILLPLLLHFQLIVPFWPDAQPYDMALFVIAAAMVVWLNRRTMFTRGHGVTEIVPPGG
jgi:membrane protease YdiL (CAAX protease family)